jgi:hypothetical protein
MRLSCLREQLNMVEIKASRYDGRAAPFVTAAGDVGATVTTAIFLNCGSIIERSGGSR